MRRYQPSLCVCVSVCVCACLSHAGRYCIKTAKRRITQTTQRDSPGTLVFWHQELLVDDAPSPLKFALILKWPTPVQKPQFRPISAHIAVCRDAARRAGLSATAELLVRCSGCHCRSCRSAVSVWSCVRPLDGCTLLTVLWFLVSMTSLTGHVPRTSPSRRNRWNLIPFHQRNSEVCLSVLNVYIIYWMIWQFCGTVALRIHEHLPFLLLARLMSQYCFARWCLSVCLRRLSSFVTLPACGRAGRRARGRSCGRHCTAGQYGYVPLGWHLV